MLNHLQSFIEWGSCRYAPVTIKNYEFLIRKFIDYTGEMKLSKVNVSIISRYCASLKNHYSDSTVAYSMIALRNFFKFLFLQRLIKWDWQLIQVPRYISRSYPPVDTEEAKKMIDSIAVQTLADLRNKTILSFLYVSGVRVSELCDLRVEELELDKHYGHIISKKNQQKRMVFWDGETAQLLDEYFSEKPDSEYVFVSLDRRTCGHKLSTRSIQRMVEKYRFHNSVTPHSFRHGLGMRAVKSNVHMRYIQKILGHKNINSSQIYLDVVDDDVVAAFAKIAR